MALQLALTTGSGITCSASYTVVTHCNVEFTIVGGKYVYVVKAIANLYRDKAGWATSLEPLDVFNWTFTYNSSCTVRGVGCLIDQAESSLMAKTTVAGVALPGSTKNVHKNRNFNFTGATKVA